MNFWQLDRMRACEDRANRPSDGVWEQVFCQGRRCDGKSVCGLGVAFACAVGHSETLLQSFKGFRGCWGFRGLGAGKRQAWTPIRSH